MRHVRAPGCPECGRSDASEVLEVGRLRVVRCPTCSLHYLASWKDELARWDELYAYHANPAAFDVCKGYSDVSRRRQLALLERFAARVRGRRLLDVGAGRGQLVHTADTAGWDALGIDLSDDAVSACRAAGLPVEHVDFFAESLSARRFDVIVMSEFIEHVASPGRFFARIEELLAPGEIGRAHV